MPIVRTTRRETGVAQPRPRDGRRSFARRDAQTPIAPARRRGVGRQPSWTVTEEDAQDVPIGITDLRLSGERSYLVAVVAERLQRLEDDGVVRGYRSDIDPRQLGYTQIASVSASPAMTATSPPPTCVTSATPQTPRELQ